MFAITESTRKVYGKEVTTYTGEIYSANVLKAEAGTGGFQGGDSGHGSRAHIRIEDMGGVDICVNPLGLDGEEGVKLFLGGTMNWEPWSLHLSSLPKRWKMEPRRRVINVHTL